MTQERENISKDEMLELLCKTLENILSKTRFTKSNPLDRSFDISKIRPEAKKVISKYKIWKRQITTIK